MGKEKGKDPDFWLVEAKKLIDKAVLEKEDLSPEELGQLRADLAIVRYYISLETFPVYAARRSEAFLEMESLESKAFLHFFKRLINADMTDEKGEKVTDAKGNPKKYTTSISESIARKSINSKDTQNTSYYDAKKHYVESKDQEQKIYQLMKSIDQVLHSLAWLAKD